MKIALSALMLVCLGLTACIAEPTDPVQLGEICVPDDDVCASTALLARDAVGRNQLDYTVSNLGTGVASVRVQALIPAGDTVADMGEDAGVVDELDRVITERIHRVAAGDTDGSRFTPQELGIRESFEFKVQCAGCTTRVDFVLTSVPLECIEDDDCSGGWLCDTNIPGRCVECTDDDECDVDQSCDTNRGRCTPAKDESGCQAPGSPADGLTLVAMILLVLGLVGRRLRTAREAAQRSWFTFTLFCSISIGGALYAPPAAADPPIASISIGTGARMLTGELGEVSDLGLAFLISQELRWQNFGGAVRLDTAYFLTNQEAPPFSKDFRTTAVSVGPRAYLPIGDWEIVGGVDYVRFGVSANSLVQITGTDTSFNGVLGLVGGRYKWSGIEVRADMGYEHLFNLPGAVMFLDLSLAISASL